VAEEKEDTMSMRKQALVLVAVILGLSALGLSVLREPIAAPTSGSAAAQAAPSELRVALGKSLIVNSPDTLKRVAISKPDIASAILISERQILINGRKAGVTTLVFWDTDENPRSFELSVVLELSPIRETLRKIFPEENVQLTQSGGAVVLNGIVPDEALSGQIEAVAKTQNSTVVNLLEIAENHDTVLLQVRFAEVNRRQLQELGVNIFSTGAAGTIGTTSTQQFGPTSGQTNVGDGEFRLTDLLNIFIFRPDLNLGATIRALQGRNLLEILAEPNVLALNGREASFLAGGEFPFPVVQGGTNLAVTIQFREFGVRLTFTPNILENGKIRLKVAPEVSALDFANSVTLSGFTIPALSTRRAETEVELLDGQSFAIAGLIDNRMIENASKVPVLGDIPILGKLFQSRSLDRSTNELMVMVTPRVVKPLDPDQVPEGPAFPAPFLDQPKFDEKYKKKGEAQEKGTP
jgi:pilus assembly protein CpaC